VQINLMQAKNLSYIVVDNLYLPEELKQIKVELRALKEYVKSPEETGVAMDKNETPKRNAHGLFLDKHYQDRNSSDILRLNRKLFCEELVVKATEFNQYFYTIRNCNNDSTLINFYGADEEYRPHRDNSALTAITFFSTGNISGGDFEFPEVNEVVPFKENRAVIFPGCVEHAAKQTQAKPGSYRVSMAQFLNYRT
jgi:hypothetical protein